MSERETAVTVHGDVEYETVECESCGERVAATHATDVIVGEVTNVSEYTSISNRYKFANGMNRGQLCDYCRDDPAAYPSGRYFDLLASTRALLTAMLLATSAGLFVLGVHLL